VVDCTAFRLNGGCATARTAATITGMCSGNAPARAAFAAISSRVARPSSGASVATSSSAVPPTSSRRTRSGVGGSTGKPSDQPSSITKSWNASRSSGASISSGGVGRAAAAGVE
jgi:hypothetical protein